MVAACSANPTPDVSLASDVGSLVFAISQITDPRWRLDALVRLVPSLHRINAPTDWIRARVRREAAGAICPSPLRGRLTTLLTEGLEYGKADGLAAVVTALWSRDWQGAAFGGVGAALSLGDHDAARQLALYHHVVDSPLGGHRARLDDFVRRGYVAEHGGERCWPRLVANVDRRCAEEAFVPSLPLLVGVVDAICASGDAGRVDDAEAMLGKVRDHERPMAVAHLARLALRFGGMAAGRRRARSIRERSIRAGAQLWVVREAIVTGQLDMARELVGDIDNPRVGQWARLELSRGLFGAGRVVDALRVLQQVSEPGLMAERLILLNEMRLVVRRNEDTSVGVFDALPFALAMQEWLAPAGWVDTGSRHDITAGVGLLRHGLDPCVNRRVAHRRAFLELAERAGVDVDAALLHLKAPFLSARVEQRAERLQGTMPALRPVAEARSLERACFDEQLALRNDARPRRRSLIGAAQTCLRSALTAPHGWSDDVVAARLRTLVQLGGVLARDAILKALQTLPVRTPTTARAIAALCCIDAEAARDFVLARFAGLPDLRGLLLLLGRHAATPRDFEWVFMRARRMRGDAWLARFLTLAGGMPSVEMLESATDATRFASVDELFADVTASIEALQHHPHVDVAACLAKDRDLLGKILVWQAPRLTTTWTLDKWQQHLQRAATYRTIDWRIVRRFERVLGRPHPTAMPCADVAVGGTTYRVRLLDKRRDILTYLRFADVRARSCFHTDSPYNRSADTIAAWMDPLTFCFHIEREDQGYRPCGFLFGSFAEIDGAPAVVMNSLHVRPRNAELREKIVRAVEQAFCAPLGITRIGIANDHGGRGPLPADYVERDVTLTRYRALVDPEDPLDDLTGVLNERSEVFVLWRSSETR